MQSGKSPDDLAQRLTYALNILASMEEKGIELLLIGAEKTDSDTCVGEILSRVIEDVVSLSMALAIACDVKINYVVMTKPMAYDDKVDSSILPDAAVLYQAIVHVPVYLLRAMDHYDIIKGSITISVEREEEFVILRIASAEVPLDPGTDKFLSWPKNISREEAGLWFARYLLETRGGSLAVEDGAFVFKLPTA